MYQDVNDKLGDNIKISASSIMIPHCYKDNRSKMRNNNFIKITKI